MHRVCWCPSATHWGHASNRLETPCSSCTPMFFLFDPKAPSSFRPCAGYSRRRPGERATAHRVHATGMFYPWVLFQVPSVRRSTVCSAKQISPSLRSPVATGSKKLPTTIGRAYPCGLAHPWPTMHPHRPSTIPYHIRIILAALLCWQSLPALPRGSSRVLTLFGVLMVLASTSCQTNVGAGKYCPGLFPRCRSADPLVDLARTDARTDGRLRPPNQPKVVVGGNHRCPRLSTPQCEAAQAFTATNAIRHCTSALRT